MKCLLYIEKGDEVKADEDKEYQQDDEDEGDDDEEEVQNFLKNFSSNFCSFRTLRLKTNLIQKNLR